LNKLLFLTLILSLNSFSSWAGCDDVNSVAERYQVLVPTSESGYVVNDTKRVYFYSAPDEKCKIKGLFIVYGDLINLYAEYQGFSSVIFFKENGDSVIGWVHSKSIKTTGTGGGPEK